MNGVEIVAAEAAGVAEVEGKAIALQEISELILLQNLLNPLLCVMTSLFSFDKVLTIGTTQQICQGVFLDLSGFLVAQYLET